MTAFANILIFQPAAIGDVMLATPVAKALKQNYPAAKITFWGHSLLRQLLVGLCPYIDEYIDYERQAGLIALLKTFWSVNCDLFVDLSNSKRGMFISAFAPNNVRIVAYKKQSADAPNKMHAVENFLATVDRICEEIPNPLFPTIFPEAVADEVLVDILGDKRDKLLVGVVPGVGKLRPHRAWIRDGWHYLLSALLERESCLPVLIGGEDEIELGEKLEDGFAGKCLNVIGKLDLSQTAAILKRCSVVVSGDTGPAHMAVAVGTPVIGLYGPTSPRRSGPYGFENLVIDQSNACRCSESKFCSFAPSDDPGECMSRIMLLEVIDKLNQVLGPLPEPQAPPLEEWQST
jgi:ADP-heptose:LPS heptosyltransferase